MPAWLAGRPVVGELDHLFIVVAHRPGGVPAARYSYGPSGGVAGMGSWLVALHGSDTPTDRDDAAAWRALSDARSALANGISAVQINTTIARVVESARLVDRALGAIGRRGDWPVRYAVLTNPASSATAANSNSAAYAVCMGALGEGGLQRLPPTTRAPGWEQYRHVLDKIGQCVAVQPR